MPVTRAELKKAAHAKNPKPLVFSPAAAIKRLRKKGDLFAPLLTMKQRLPKAFAKTKAPADLLGGAHGAGDLNLRLHGKKPKGGWHLFRIRSGDTKPVWLIAKSKVPAKAVSELQDDRSVLTRRSMARIAKDNNAQWRSR